MRKYEFSEDVKDVSLVDIWGKSIQTDGIASGIARAKDVRLKHGRHSQGGVGGKCGLGRISRGDSSRS